MGGASGACTAFVDGGFLVASRKLSPKLGYGCNAAAWGRDKPPWSVRVLNVHLKSWTAWQRYDTYIMYFCTDDVLTIDYYILIAISSLMKHYIYLDVFGVFACCVGMQPGLFYFFTTLHEHWMAPFDQFSKATKNGRIITLQWVRSSHEVWRPSRAY